MRFIFIITYKDWFKFISKWIPYEVFHDIFCTFYLGVEFLFSAFGINNSFRFEPILIQLTDSFEVKNHLSVIHKTHSAFITSMYLSNVSPLPFFVAIFVLVLLIIIIFWSIEWFLVLYSSLKLYLTQVKGIYQFHKVRSSYFALIIYFWHKIWNATKSFLMEILF
jgi:hypothetical protein